MSGGESELYIATIVKPTPPGLLFAKTLTGADLIIGIGLCLHKGDVEVEGATLTCTCVQQDPLHLEWGDTPPCMLNHVDPHLLCAKDWDWTVCHGCRQSCNSLRKPTQMPANDVLLAKTN